MTEQTRENQLVEWVSGQKHHLERRTVRNIRPDPDDEFHTFDELGEVNFSGRELRVVRRHTWEADKWMITAYVPTYLSSDEGD